MSTFTTRTFTNVFTDARAIGLLNDPSSDRYPDAVLLPHGAYTHNDIQEEFAASGIPMVETVVDTPTYTALAETIVIPAGITDLREPLELWEKNTGDEVWSPMTRVSYLRPPLVSPGVRLHYWEWQNGAIRVLPCSVAREIFMRYRRQLAYPTAAGEIGFDGIYFALVAGTAYLAATSRPDVQAKAGAMYAKRLEKMIGIASRDRQGIVYRRRAWNDTSERYPVIMEPNG